jgi:hypothetical protein
MALDKETALQIAHRKTTKYRHNEETPFIFNEMHMNDYAQAIYALGVADERERAIKAVDDAGGDNCEYHIEAIRKGGE